PGYVHRARRRNRGPPKRRPNEARESLTRARTRSRGSLGFSRLRPSPRGGAGAARESGQADRPVSTSPLSALRRVHAWPINLVVFEGPDGEDSFWSWLHAYMLSAFLRSRHSYPALPLAGQ